MLTIDRSDLTLLQEEMRPEATIARSWPPGSSAELWPCACTEECDSLTRNHRLRVAVFRLACHPVGLPASYCGRPICFMYVWLSQNRYSSSIVPFFQCPTVHMTIL